MTVTRIADPGGTVSFAGAGYYAGWAYRRQQVQVSLVGDTVQLALAGRVIKATRSATTGPRSTVPSPPPTDGHDAAALVSLSTRSHLSSGSRSQPVARVPGLDSGQPAVCPATLIQAGSPAKGSRVGHRLRAVPTSSGGLVSRMSADQPSSASLAVSSPGV